MNTRNVPRSLASRFLAPFLAALYLFVPGAVPRARAQSGWFPFSLPWDDSSKTAVDASDLLVDYPGQDPASVVDSRGHLLAGPDGHFRFQKTGRRARFWGVNFTFGANFPPSPDQPPRAGEPVDDRLADKVARRLAKLGVNIVRFHHMDYFARPNGIWDPAFFPNDTQHLDPAQVQRLDYLIGQLRRNGIYVNLNLKVARHFGPGDGIADSTLFRGPLSFFQGVSHFDRRMIDLQREYARALLGHRNPYTGLTYAEDPVVAFVEIANEDSLFGNLLNEGGLNYSPGISGSIPEPYSRELESQWNSWLAGRYASRDDLAAAWESGEVVEDPSDRIRNGGFEAGMAPWSVYPIGTAQASARIEAGSGPDGTAALRVDITSDGTNWHVQAIQNGLSIRKGRTYEITFYARASRAGEVTLDVMKGADPWSNYGLSLPVQLTTSWARYSGRFRANATDETTVRPTFELGARDNSIWIDQVEFHETVPMELGANESFDSGTVLRPDRQELGSYTSGRVLDLFRFYTEIDEKYFTGMRRYLKDDLGVKALVTGTAPWWGYLGDVAVQSQLDYVDGHYYWDHPYWPAGHEWEPTGWKIGNTPLVNQLQSLAGLASQAVSGRPFTVSEFNEVFPNRYALEGPPLAALVANLQDWDAVYLFDYADAPADFTQTFTRSFFTVSGNPVKTAQSPICSRIFLGTQSSPASERLSLNLDRSRLPAGYAQGLVGAADYLAAEGVDRRAFLKSQLRIASFDSPAQGSLEYALPAGSITSSGGELSWKVDDPSAASVRVRGPAVQGAIGFLKGNPVDMGDWSFVVADGPEHLAVLLQSRDRVPLRETRRMLLSVWTEHENTGMVWNDARTTVESRWGSAPVLIRPAAIDLILRFRSMRSVLLFPLDETGARKAALAAETVEGVARFRIDTGRDRTFWYEVELNEAADRRVFSVESPDAFQLYSDAAAGDLQAGWIDAANESGIPLQPAAFLEYTSRGVLTSVVRLPAATPTILMRAAVIRDGVVDTAIAVLNRQAVDNTVTLRLLDANGTPRGEPVALLLRPGGEEAFFVRERFDMAASFEGVLELRSPAPFYAVALRSIYTASGDFSLAPYPQESVSAGPLYFAHLTADSAYSTDVLMWNPHEAPVAVRLSFFSPDGHPSAASGLPATQDLTLGPGEMKRLTIARGDSTFFGYARLSLLSGVALPSATAVMTRWEDGAPVSEAGIPATPAVAEDLMLVAERPAQRTALALLNPSESPVTVDLEILGSESPLPGLHTLTLDAGAKRAFFLNEVFRDLPAYATATLRIRGSTPVAVLALLGIINERGNFLMAAITGEPGREPVKPGNSATAPRFATGGGYRTVLYFLPAGAGPAKGLIRFFDSAGAALPLLFR